MNKDDIMEFLLSNFTSQQILELLINYIGTTNSVVSIVQSMENSDLELMFKLIFENQRVFLTEKGKNHVEKNHDKSGR